MAVKAIVFVVAFAGVGCAAVYAPIVGVLGYMGTYLVWPERQWWGQAISHWGIRYSFLLGLTTAVGAAIHYRQLRFGRRLVNSQEWLLAAFVCVTCLLSVFLPPQGMLGGEDTVVLKLVKIGCFALLLSHVATGVREVRWVTWVLVGGAAFLGYEAFTAGAASFREGRLNNVGGPDFREANAFAACLGACLPFIWVRFLTSKWGGKAFSVAAGVLATNAIVLTRSRGALVGVLGGLIVAGCAAPKRLRRVVVMGVCLVLLGGYTLANKAFWERAETTAAGEGERGYSTQSRLDIWAGSLDMLMAHPFGVGPGNFEVSIGEYVPAYLGGRADAHSTYVRCYGELGIVAFALLVALVCNALLQLMVVYRRAEALTVEVCRELQLTAYATAVGLCIMLISGVTMTLLYVEAMWWLLMMPVCLRRCIENLENMAGIRARRGLPVAKTVG